MPGIRGYLIGQTVLVLGFDGNLTIHQHGRAYYAFKFSLDSPNTIYLCWTWSCTPYWFIWQCILKAALFVRELGNMPTILGTLLKCIGLPCMGHQCLRSRLFKIDENLALCDIPTKKVTLGWDLHVLSKDIWPQLWLNSFLPIIKYSILICLIQYK